MGWFWIYANKDNIILQNNETFGTKITSHPQS